MTLVTAGIILADLTVIIGSSYLAPELLADMASPTARFKRRPKALNTLLSAALLAIIFCMAVIAILDLATTLRGLM